MNDKIKQAEDFTKKHKKGLATTAAFCSWSIICYKMGRRREKKLIGRGLERIILVNPEIKSLIEDACMKIRKLNK